VVALDLSLHYKQGVAFQSEATEILYGGAAGGGKSFLMRVAAILWCLQVPKLQVYLFRRKYPDLIANHIDGSQRKEFGRLFIGIALLLASADGIVKLSSSLASTAGIPIFVVGLVVLAIGTSLPELAFSIKSISEHEPSMFFGNLLGSTIANSTLIVGTVSLIAPIKVIAFNEYLLAAVAFILVFSGFWFFVRSKHRLDRWEGGILLLIYITFLILEFSRQV